VSFAQTAGVLLLAGSTAFAYGTLPGWLTAAAAGSCADGSGAGRGIALG